MNETTCHFLHEARSAAVGTTVVARFDQTLHWLTTALCTLVCVAPFVAWTAPVRQALVAIVI